MAFPGPRDSNRHRDRREVHRACTWRVVSGDPKGTRNRGVRLIAAVAFKATQHRSGTIADMDARSGPGLNDPFDEAIDDALNSLPVDLRAAMSNVEIVVEDEPPDGQPLLGLYRGVPLPRRSSTYSGVLPDKISIFGGPITRLAAGDEDRLRREVRHVVLHEIAHHFGISDERLIELDRY
jgi:predicted Zn-dependent protease with MMP-like domain